MNKMSTEQLFQILINYIINLLLVIEPRALYMLDKFITTKLYWQLSSIFYYYTDRINN